VPFWLLLSLVCPLRKAIYGLNKPRPVLLFEVQHSGYPGRVYCSEWSWFGHVRISLSSRTCYSVVVCWWYQTDRWFTPLPYRWSSVAFINYLLWRRWRARPKPFLGLEVHILLVDIWYLRSNNVMTWSLELNSMMRRLLTLPWSFTLNSVRLTISDPTQYRQ
jgi:hypothetical protein